LRSSPPVYGDVISDPRCACDAAVNRFFVTIRHIGVDPATGNFLPESSFLIAVSQTVDPTGTRNRYRLSTAADGSLRTGY
jgi:hypothetical protein